VLFGFFVVGAARADDIDHCAAKDDVGLMKEVPSPGHTRRETPPHAQRRSATNHNFTSTKSNT
jgi:hypothetical protein